MKTDNQDADVAVKYEEGRHHIRDRRKSDAAFSTPPSNCWPPDESDDLYLINSSIGSDGDLDDKKFNSWMTTIFGEVSKKGPPPLIPVTQRHIHQLEAFRDQLPQDDRAFVATWLSILRVHEKKKGNIMSTHHKFD